MVAALILSLFASPQEPTHRLVLLGAGRFAQFADLSTVRRAGASGRVRVLQVADAGFRVGADAYWGGWSWFDFDCEAGAVDRLDFAAVREGGIEGPTTPDDAPAYPAALGGDARELLDVVCDDAPPPADATTVAQAVSLGRGALDY